MYNLLTITKTADMYLSTFFLVTAPTVIQLNARTEIHGTWSLSRCDSISDLKGMRRET